MRVTMAEVAAAAGVSKSSVSRAFSNVPNAVSPEVARRIRAVADELGYIPSRAASSLTTRKTHTVGFLAADITNPFFAEIVAEMQRALAGSGLSLLFATTDNDPSREADEIRALLSHGVDALVVALNSQNDTGVKSLLLHAERTLLVNSRVRGLALPSITVDNVAGARAATAHLIALGHRRIATISGPSYSLSGHGRLVGFHQEVEAGPEPMKALVENGDFTASGGILAARRLLDRPDPPTALFVANNAMTFGALEVIRERGLRVPEDVSIVGFDDLPWYPHASTPLTAVSQPVREIGRLASQWVLDPASLARTGTCLELPTELVIRASTAPPPIR